ncbi:hypothetical protein A8924_5535 [Saccharopolyspora erythraea NRRL 2338]|nr:hypothetical protein A8924_5535 [Saccharopolyspora erythraea NRRL 2338]
MLPGMIDRLGTGTWEETSEKAAMSESLRGTAVPMVRLVPWVAAFYLASGCVGGAHSTSSGPVPTTAAPTTETATPTTTAETTTTETTTSETDDVQNWDHVAVCVDPETEVRLPDEDCEDAPTDYTDVSGQHVGVAALWYHYSTSAGAFAAPVGTRVSGGSYTTPKTGPSGQTAAVGRAGSVPTTGGTIPRGGFGTGTSGTSVGG